MAESYRRLFENPDNSSLSPDELLGIIVDAEWTSRQNKRLKRLLQQSGMMQGPCALKILTIVPQETWIGK